jgi:hypothetical protein
LWKELFNTTETASKSLEDWVLRVQEVFHNSMLRGASNVVLHVEGSSDTIQPNAQVMQQMARAISLYNAYTHMTAGTSAEFRLMARNPIDAQNIQAGIKEFATLVDSLKKLDPRTREFAIFGLLNDLAQDASAARTSKLHGKARYLSLLDLDLSDIEYDVAEKTLDDFRHYYGPFANASHNAHARVQTLPTEHAPEPLEQHVFDTVDTILRMSDALFTDGNRDKDNWAHTLAVDVRVRPYGHIAKRMRILTEKIQSIDRIATNEKPTSVRDDLLLRYELTVKQLLDTTPAPPVAPRIALA